MACKLSSQCDLIFGILNCTLPEDTIDVDLKVHTLWKIHTYKKDRGTQVIKCSPWGAEVKTISSLQKKMADSMRHRQIITTPFANRSFQPRPEVVAGKCNQVTLTMPNRAKLLQPRKINVRPLCKATQQKWLATLIAKEAAGATTCQGPTQISQPMDTPSILSPTSAVPPEHTKYCAICTQLGKICPKEFPMSLDWDDNDEEEGKDQNKGEDQNNTERKTSKTSPRFFAATTLTPQTSHLNEAVQQ